MSINLTENLVTVFNKRYRYEKKEYENLTYFGSIFLTFDYNGFF